MEANKQPNKITSFEIEKEKSEGFFYKEGFKEWAGIPKFAVITGVNGSGKTQLLKKIYEAIQNPSVGKIKYEDEEGEKYQANEVYYKGALTQPNVHSGNATIAGIAIAKQDKKTKIEDLIGKKFSYITKNWTCSISNNRLSINEIDAEPKYYETGNLGGTLPMTLGSVTKYGTPPLQSYLLTEFATIKKIVEFLKLPNDNTDKNILEIFNNITTEDIDSYLDSLVSEQNNISAIDVSNLFLEYKKETVRLESAAFRQLSQDDTLQTFNDIKQRPKLGLIKKFGIDASPWDKINELLRKNGFLYEVQEPTDEDVYELRFKNGIRYINLSDGERVIFHLVCSAYRGNGGVGGKTKLLLLDEFDAHLNPQMSKMFVDIVENTLVKEFGMQVIMTTHSPSTAAYVPEESLFWMEEGKILQGQDKKEKMSIIHKLATGFAVEDNTCPFMSYLTDPTKPYYIIVEGYTDILHIKTACKKLGGDYEKHIFNKCNFINLGGTKETYAKTFLENFAFGKKTITIFDNDKSGAELFTKIFTKSYGQSPFIRCCKGDKDKVDNDRIAIILKPSEDTRYSADYSDQINFGYIPIELLYSKDVVDAFNKGNDNKFLSNYQDKPADEYKKHYRTQDCKNGKNIITITTNIVDRLFFIEPGELKLDFAKAAKNFDKNDFEGFKPTLDLVLTVIKKWDEELKGATKAE